MFEIEHLATGPLITHASQPTSSEFSTLCVYVHQLQYTVNVRMYYCTWRYCVSGTILNLIQLHLSIRKGLFWLFRGESTKMLPFRDTFLGT
jgi:hypothetical protein